MAKWLSVSLLPVLCAVAGGADGLEAVSRGRPLMRKIVLVNAGKPAAAIAVPDDAVHRQAAQRIQGAILEATGARLPVISDQQAVAKPGARNLVVIGNLMTNRVAERLYRNYYVAADGYTPGPGRYEWFKRFLGGSWNPDWNLGHTYAANLEPRMPDHILGVTVIPAEDWIYKAGMGQVETRQ